MMEIIEAATDEAAEQTFAIKLVSRSISSTDQSSGDDKEGSSVHARNKEINEEGILEVEEGNKTSQIQTDSSECLCLEKTTEQRNLSDTEDDGLYGNEKDEKKAENSTDITSNENLTTETIGTPDSRKQSCSNHEQDNIERNGIEEVENLEIFENSSTSSKLELHEKSDVSKTVDTSEDQNTLLLAKVTEIERRLDESQDNVQVVMERLNEVLVKENSSGQKNVSLSNQLVLQNQVSSIEDNLCKVRKTIEHLRFENFQKENKIRENEFLVQSLENRLKHVERLQKTESNSQSDVPAAIPQRMLTNKSKICCLL